MGSGVPDFREAQMENSAKTGKIPQFLKALKDDFYHLSLNGKNDPHFTILTQNAFSDLKHNPENSKKYFSEQI